MLDITLLGTGGTQPLPERALAAACITVGGSNLLLDCGEGTQTAAGRGQYFPHGRHSADPLPRGPHFRPARHLADDGRPGPHCPPRHGWAAGLDGCGAHLLRRGRTAAVRTTTERTAGLQRRV